MDKELNKIEKTVKTTKDNKIDKRKDNGGIRPNSGRKPGVCKATKLRRMFQDYVTDKEVLELVNIAKVKAKEDPQVLRLVLEQIFGKAPQSLSIDTKKPIKVALADEEKQLLTDILKKQGLY